MAENNLTDFDKLDKTALITEHGKCVSFQELRKEIKHLANKLAPRSIIFIICKNDFPAVLCYLTSLEISVIPLLLSQDLSKEQISELCDCYQPRYIFSQADSFSDYLKVCDVENYGLFERNVLPHYEINNELAFLASTSGSTGSPKLVRFSKANLLSNAHSIVEYLNIDHNERAFLHLPLHYSYGFSILNSHLLAGATVVLTNRTIMEKEFWQDLAHYKITSFSGVPFHYQALLRMRFENMHLPDLKTMTQAGGKLDAKYTAKLIEHCDTLGIKFYCMYGQTEASPRISFVPPDQIANKVGAIGQSIPGGELWLEEQSGEKITASQKIGELVYRGDNVCLGYATSYHDFVKGDDNNHILKTGDMAYFDEDGCFFIEGRIKRFIKVFGNRISLEHVENIIKKQDLECIAAGKDDKLVIGVVTKQLKEFNAIQFKKDLAALIGINFVAIKIIELSAIPYLSNGKVNYQCLQV